MATENSVKSYRRGGAAAEIHDVLHDEILTLQLEPGSPLEEVKLSKRFGVSRSPIREALSRLTSARLVKTLPNHTSIVAPVDLRLFPYFMQSLDIQQRLASRLAAKNRSDDDIPKLRELADDFNHYVEQGNPLDIMQANFKFHMAIGEAGGNPFVIRQYGELLSEARRLLHIHVRYLDTQKRKHLMRDQHHDFVDAIQAQDEATADAVAHAHAMQFHERFLKALEYMPDDQVSLSELSIFDKKEEA